MPSTVRVRNVYECLRYRRVGQAPSIKHHHALGQMSDEGKDDRQTSGTLPAAKGRYERFANCQQGLPNQHIRSFRLITMLARGAMPPATNNSSYLCPFYRRLLLHRLTYLTATAVRSSLNDLLRMSYLLLLSESSFFHVYIKCLRVLSLRRGCLWYDTQTHRQLTWQTCILDSC